MVMGVEKAQHVLAQHPDLMAYLIYSDQDGKNAVWYSPSLKNKIQQ
jgi:thiamine biosynthesis lipoprotein